VSNATLQWVPGHRDLLPDLVRWLAPGGWFAFQVPGNFGEPAHVLLRNVADSPRWRDRVGADVVPRPASCEVLDYLDMLLTVGCVVDVTDVRCCARAPAVSSVGAPVTPRVHRTPGPRNAYP